MEIRPILFFSSIEDRTADAYKTLPSVNLTLNDRRIDALSNDRTDAYLVVVSEKTEDFVVIVNPKAKSGFLWWKRPKKLVMSKSRFTAIKNQTELPTDIENGFFKELEVTLPKGLK